ncbi:UNVERIFIED_CONTAM: hypothetical protein Slati_2397400 [Sesamum latifolium]|uniref:Retrotransposon gag domain-containing protein n=1 Tax=Sesamum latifolium TaxID=2727402 RepID=A0AAW2WBQ6_9LAMI
MATPLMNVRVPQLPSYTREKGDPRDHVNQFIAAMDLINADEAMLCRTFQTTLIGRAQTWFSQQPSGSIYSFDKMAQNFVLHFASNKRLPKNPSHLFAIIQEEGESLKSYMQRFSNEVLDIPNMNLEFILGIVAQGLRSGGLPDSLIGEPATSWEELLIRAERFILIEESRKIKGSYSARREPARESAKKIQEWRKDDHRCKAEFYTPLKTTQTEALGIIESSGIKRWPVKMKENEGR